MFKGFSQIDSRINFKQNFEVRVVDSHKFRGRRATATEEPQEEVKQEPAVGWNGVYIDRLKPGKMTRSEDDIDFEYMLPFEFFASATPEAL